MYLAQITIENFRCFGTGDQRLELAFKPGLTALVGENDGGKTAIIDALRFVFGTTDQEVQRLEITDFHRPSTAAGDVNELDVCQWKVGIRDKERSPTS